VLGVGVVFITLVGGFGTEGDGGFDTKTAALCSHS
jgi:hypothetical protein